MNKVELFNKKKKMIFFFLMVYSKQCNDMKTFLFFLGGGEDILGLAISLIFDQFSIL